MAHIVILDDCLFELKQYISAIQLVGHTVTTFDEVDAFFEYLESGNSADIFVLDVMMPEKSVLLNSAAISTNGGHETGIVVARALRYLGLETPIILFSVAHLGPTISSIKLFSDSDSNTAYVPKHRSEPYKFAEFICELAEAGTVPQGKWEFLRIFGNAISLKPGWGPITIDAKAIYAAFRKNT